MDFRFLASLGLGLALLTVLRAADEVLPEKTVKVAAVPAWVRFANETVENIWRASPSGVEYILLDQQDEVASKASFNRSMYRVTSDSGLQAASQISVSFDPDYQTLDWHFLRVWRHGVVTDRLELPKFKTIQQERALDRHEYNGRLTSLCLLDDIRVGDVVDFAYTLRGTNPVFNGRYGETFYTGWTVPVRHQRVRILIPSGQTLASRFHGKNKASFTVIPADGGTEYRWEARYLPATSIDSDIPRWYNPLSYGEVSAYRDWAEVAKWAVPLFGTPPDQVLEMRKKAQELSAGKSGAEAEIAAILDFVQHEIRYLGMELGPGSHRPSPPAEVLARRFGDCKDKVRLFCALVNQIGYIAKPALVHSERRETLLESLPSPLAFDHVIALVTLGTKTFWLDPTLLYQKGDLEQRPSPWYGPALIVDGGTHDLTLMPRPSALSSNVSTEETFNVTSLDAPVTLLVQTLYYGEMAERMRAYRAQVSAEEVNRDLLNHYSRIYPGITMSSAPAWQEVDDRQLVSVRQSYVIPSLWTLNPATGRKEAAFSPLVLRNYLAQPDAPQRSSPLAISYPASVSLLTWINLPRAWPVESESYDRKTDAFEFGSSIGSADRRVTISYRWKALADHVPLEKVGEHVAALTKLRESAGYTLIDRPPLPPKIIEPFSFNWSLGLVGIMVFLGAGYAACRIFFWVPDWPPQPVDLRFTGKFGGWLILVAIGVLVRPFALIATFYGQRAAFFDQRIWVALTVPGGAAYKPAYAPLLAFELAANIVMFVTSILLVGLFFQKRRQAPGVMVFFFVTALGFQASMRRGFRRSRRIQNRGERVRRYDGSVHPLCYLDPVFSDLHSGEKYVCRLSRGLSVRQLAVGSFDSLRIPREKSGRRWLARACFSIGSNNNVGRLLSFRAFVVSSDCHNLAERLAALSCLIFC